MTDLSKAGTFRLGHRDVKRMGYGAMQLAGPGVFGPPKDREQAVAVLREAVASGVNHIDTSDYYGPHVVNEIIRVDPPGQLIVRPGAAGDLLVKCAITGLGIINSFDDMLAPHFESGELEPVLESWWERFSGPFLYYPGRRHLPTPLRAFVDFIKTQRG